MRLGLITLPDRVTEGPRAGGDVCRGEINRTNSRSLNVTRLTRGLLEYIGDRCAIGEGAAVMVVKSVVDGDSDPLGLETDVVPIRTL